MYKIVKTGFLEYIFSIQVPKNKIVLLNLIFCQILENFKVREKRIGITIHIPIRKLMMTSNTHLY